jgi:hypothetical protein
MHGESAVPRTYRLPHSLDLWVMNHAAATSRTRSSIIVEALHLFMLDFAIPRSTETPEPSPEGEALVSSS